MAAKAFSFQQKASDEIFFQNDAVSLCLLINRRARIMRVIDFRAGPSSAKRQLVLSLALREGVEKAYTLVERDEVQTWIKLGFAKEGNVPGFYKRSDAFLLGCPVSSASTAPARSSPSAESPVESETRLVAAKPVGSAASMTAGQERMERTIASAKRGLKDVLEKMPQQARIAVIDEPEARKLAVAAVRAGRGLTAFEPFGRDVERTYFLVTVRGGFEFAASAESQACFGNAFLELLVAPKTEGEKMATAGALRALCERLLSEGVVSCFALAPSDDVGLASAFLSNGFRRTGLLAEHMMVGGHRKDAILWSRKLANPTEE
ncbi:MAG: hypothetical protein ABSC94_09255 [Polyangiaceae bacterium]|jgi:hypothetical protein